MDAKSMMAKAVMAASLCAVTTGLSALGGTYYVSPDGTGAAFSPEAPGSLADVVSRAGEGDEIVLKRGVYHLPSIFSAPNGTDGAYDYLSLSGKSGLVFRSEDGDRRGTVLSGDGAKVSDSVGIRAAYFHGPMTFCGMTVSNFCGSYGGAITAQGRRSRTASSSATVRSMAAARDATERGSTASSSPTAPTRAARCCMPSLSRTACSAATRRTGPAPSARTGTSFGTASS